MLCSPERTYALVGDLAPVDREALLANKVVAGDCCAEARACVGAADPALDRVAGCRTRDREMFSRERQIDVYLLGRF